MTEYTDSRFEASSYDLRVPTTGGFRGTAAPASARAFADGPALGSLVGALGGQVYGYGHALRQRVVVGGALIPNAPVSGLLPVRRQVLTS